MPLLHDLYLLCAIGGFIYLVGTAVMGFANASDMGGDAGGDAGSIDAGGDAGADAGGDASGIDVGDIQQLQQARGTGLAYARTGIQPARRINLGLLLLKITSPYTIACFAFFFGLAGLILSKYLPVGLLTLVPATISGVIGYNLMTAVMNRVADKLYASSTHREVEVIGTVGEVTVPIAPGRTGEIIYLTGKTRHTAPAKAKEQGAELRKSSKVMIADIVDGVFIVEPYTDIALDDSVMISSQ